MSGVSDDVRLRMAQAFMEAWWQHSLHAPVDWDRMTAAARQAYLDGIDAALLVLYVEPTQ